MLKYENEINDREIIMSDPGILKCKNSEFKWGERTYVMGIINASPDSFSGDGLTSLESAIVQAKTMVIEGADILDVGGESTRPGFAPVSIDEEIKRVIPIIEQLSPLVTVPISIDSNKHAVVRRALDAGANIINDQWGLKSEPRLADLAAERGVPLILMNNLRDRETPVPDIMGEVITTLKKSIDTAMRQGVPIENIIIDPGIGFVKSWEGDLSILRRLDELKVLGRPILLGPSRKSYIKMILGLPANERVEGTAAAVAIGISKGADIVRVHDVKQMVRVCKVSDAIVRIK
jgi:dihydropteroate synthase